MTEKQILAAPSLLPYLTDRGSGVRLKLDLPGYEPGRHPDPSTAIESQGPYAEILKACLTADGHTAFKHLFLLVQPDHYAISPSELTPVSNTTVDHLWQSAWERIKGTTDGDFSPVLPGQIDDKGQLIPLRPLFYCRHKERFAHPLCPNCGASLTLCRDGRLLTAAGLPSYEKTLERYLHCPECHPSNQEAVFYVHGGTAAQGDQIKDCAALLEGFSALLTKTGLAGDLPCAGCEQATECYGPQTLVHQRMYPVSFYPFHMLMQPAPSMNAVEFLHQLSGATFDQMARHLAQYGKPGRRRHLETMKNRFAAGSGLLFSDERRFLEVLYLKLVFLEALSTLVLQPQGPFSGPVADMSLESVWVRLPRGPHRLPLFWDFALQPVDPVGRPPLAIFKTGVPMARAWQFLGTAWCYAFLVNGQQDMATVRAAVDKLLLGTGEITGIEAGALREIDPVFTPRHLLWQSPPLAVDTRWEALWCRSLLLGLEVLQAGVKADTEWSADHFRQQLQDSLEKIHTLIFQAPAGRPAAEAPVPEPTGVTAAAGSVDDAIASILQNILDGWPTTAPHPPGKTTTALEETQITPETADHPNEDGDFEATIILQSPPARTPVSPETLVAAPPDPDETVVMGAPRAEKPPAPLPRDDSQATLIIPAREHPARSGPPKQPVWDETVSSTVQPEASDLEKTVAIGPPGQGDSPSKLPGEELAATMILSPGQAPVSPAQPYTAAPDEVTRKSSLLDALEETVIQSGSSPPAAPSVRPPRAPAEEPPGDASDGLEETVIMTSQKKGKGRTPEK